MADRRIRPTREEPRRPGFCRPFFFAAISRRVSIPAWPLLRSLERGRAALARSFESGVINRVTA